MHVIGDKRNFLTALIVPNFDALTSFLKTNGNDLKDPNALVDHPDVIELFNSEVDIAMSEFSNYEKIKKFTLLTDPFSIEKGEMTPKMSIVKKVVEQNYSELINKMYS